MNRRQMLISTAALAASFFPLRRGHAAQRRRQKKILYFTRSVAYEHAVVKRNHGRLSFSEQKMVEFGQQAGFDVECTKDGRVFDGDLDRFDALVFYTCRDQDQPNEYNDPVVSAAGKRRLLDAIRAGKGFVGIHSTCASYYSKAAELENQAQVDPFIAMLGGEIVLHGESQEAAMLVASPDFPGVKNLVPSFRLTDEWYAMKNFASDLHVVLVQETEGMRTEGDANRKAYHRPPFPSTWARMHSQGRVFYTAMGHFEAVWNSRPFQDVLLGGLAWALRNVEADVAPNIDLVTPQARQLQHPNVEMNGQEGKRGQLKTVRTTV